MRWGAVGPPARSAAAILGGEASCGRAGHRTGRIAIRRAPRESPASASGEMERGGLKGTCLVLCEAWRKRTSRCVAGWSDSECEVVREEDAAPPRTLTHRHSSGDKFLLVSARFFTSICVVVLIPASGSAAHQPSNIQLPVSALFILPEIESAASRGPFCRQKAD